MSTNNQKRRNKLLNKHLKLDKLKESNVYNENLNLSHKEDLGVPRQVVLDKASVIWRTLKSHIARDPEFKQLSDEEKMSIFRNKYNYEEFMEEFPIVSRYMICHGQYSASAFDKMLSRIEKITHPPPNERPKGYMEDQWIKRQADYVQFLWEVYQKRHVSQVEKQHIWNTTYENLKKEFNDFRDLHTDIEKQIKTEKKNLDGQNARELLEWITKNKHSLSEEEQYQLITELKELINKKNNHIITEEVNLFEQKDPTILMIEHVDENRMDEIDNKYKDRKSVV